MESAPGFHSSPMGAYPAPMLENAHGAVGGGVYHHPHSAPAQPMGYDPYSFPPPHPPQAGGYHQNNGGSHMPYNNDFALNPTGLENMSITQNAPYAAAVPQKMVQ